MMRTDFLIYIGMQSNKASVVFAVKESKRNLYLLQCLLDYLLKISLLLQKSNKVSVTATKKVTSRNRN